jgi:hypothetical protein
MNHTITISKLKYMPEMSEETICFTCTVNLDGKPMWRAKNSGQGAETMLEYLKPTSGERISHEEIGKITDIVDKFVIDSIADIQREKDKKAVARKLKKALFFRIKGQKAGSYYTIKADPTNPKAREAANRDGNLDIIINDLPINEAVKYFYRYE